MRKSRRKKNQERKKAGVMSDREKDNEKKKLAKKIYIALSCLAYCPC